MAYWDSGSDTHLNFQKKISGNILKNYKRGDTTEILKLNNKPNYFFNLASFKQYISIFKIKDPGFFI